MKRSLFTISLIALALALVAPSSAHADLMKSGNYKMQSDSINFAGSKSASALYSMTDTAGEVGTGNLGADKDTVHAGFEQANLPVAAAAAAKTLNVSAPSTAGVTYPANVLYFIATPSNLPLQKIFLSWKYPSSSNGNNVTGVRIVRSTVFYPSSLSEGEVIFEGDAEQAVDNNVSAGADYYYAIFARNTKGQWSSGVLAKARILLPGEAVPEATPESLNPFAGIPQALNVDPAFAKLSLDDFDFIQDGRKITHSKDSIALDAHKEFIVHLDYAKVPEILKTIAISLSDPSDASKVFTFLLRVNKNKTAYEATIGSLDAAGIYKLNGIILDYKNQSLKHFSGSLRALALADARSFLAEVSKNPRLLYGMLALLLLAFLLVVVLVLHYNKHKRGGIVAGILIFFIFASYFTASSAAAAFNPQINYQGKLSDGFDNVVADGNYNLRFSLYSVQSGGTAIWTETTSAYVSNGLFSIMLGSTTPLTSVDFNQTLYLGVEIGGKTVTPVWDGEMNPRKVIGAVPAAFVADTLDGLDSTQFQRSDAGVNTSGYFVATSTTATSTFAGSFTVGGNVGIGTTSPTSRLDVTQAFNGQTIFTAHRITDLAPSGDFISYMSAAGFPLFRVDNSGNIIAGGIFNTGSQTITSTSTPQLRIQYDSSNEWTSSVSATGNTVFGLSGSTPSLSFVPQSNSTTTFAFKDASANTILSVDTTNRRVGVNNANPGYSFDVNGNVNVLSTNTTTLTTGLGVGAGTFVGNFANAPHNAHYLGVGGLALVSNTTNVGNDFEAYGVQAALRVDASNTGDLTNGSSGMTGLQAGWKTMTGATGTVNLIGGINVIGVPAAAGLTINDAFGIKTQGVQGVGAITNFAQFWTPNITQHYATNNTHLLLGSDTLPAGNWAIYDASGDNSTLSGNLGIGTTSPGQKLSVAGDILGNAHIGTYFTSTSTTLTNTFPNLAFTNAVGTNATTTSFFATTASSTNLFSSLLTVGGNSLVANSSGFVGIGTTSPYANLSIMAKQGQAAGSSLFAISSSTSLAGGAYLSVGSAGQLSAKGRAIDPVIVGRYASTTITGANDLYVVGKYVYVAARTDGSLNIFDASDPTNPVLIAKTTGPTGNDMPGANSVVVSGNYAYVSSQSSHSGNRFSVVDVSNPYNPTWISSTMGPIPGTSLNGVSAAVIVGKYAFLSVNGRGALAVIDISNPYKPTYVTAVTTGFLPAGPNIGIFAAGKYLYITDEEANALVIYDISDPTNPLFVSSYGGSIPGTSLKFAHGVWVRGRYAYVVSATSNNLVVIDVSNPFSPVQVGEVAGITTAVSVSVSGNYAYVTGGTTFTSVDISSSTHPFIAAQIPSDSTGRGLSVQGNYAYFISSGGPSLSIADVTGATIPNADIGSLRADALQVQGPSLFGNSVNIFGALLAGSGLTANGQSSFTYTSSTTQSADLSPLKSTVVDTSTNSFADAFILDHGTSLNAVPVAGFGTSFSFRSLLGDATTSTTTSRIASILTGTATTSPASDLVFYGKNGVGSLSEGFRLTGAGNLGIGTTTPGQKLSVAGDILGNNIIGQSFTATSTTLLNTFPQLSFTNATGTNATTTNFFSANANVTNLTATTLSAANIFATGSSTLQDFTFNNATGTAATTTNLFTSNFRVGASTLTANSLGNVGIGTTSLSQLFTVAGSNPANTYLTSAATTMSIQSLDYSVFNDNSAVNQRVNHAFDTLVNNSVNTGNIAVGISNTLADSANSTANQPNFFGIINTVQHFGTGTVTNMRGMNSSVTNSSPSTVTNLLNLSLTTGNNSTVAGATTTTAEGVRSVVNNTSPYGLITNGYGFRTIVNNTTNSTTTNLYGFAFDSFTNTGGITNTYGVYVGGITGGTQINRPYSFFAADTSAYNYFGGNVGIGTTTPGQKLSVAGDILGNNIIGQGFTATSTTLLNTFPQLSFTNATGTNATTTNFFSSQITSGGQTLAAYFTANSTTATSTVDVGGFAIGTSTPFGNGLLTVGTSSPIFYVDKSSGYVGIGTSSPTQLLTISGSNPRSAYFMSVGSIITPQYVEQSTFNDNVGIGRANHLFNTIVNNSVNTTGGTISGIYNAIADPSTNSANQPGLVAITNFIRHVGTGTIATLQGTINTVLNASPTTVTTTTGNSTTVGNATSIGATTTTALAYSGTVSNGVAQGLITTGYGYRSLLSNAANATTTTWYGFAADSFSNSGVVGSTYGFYAGTLTAGTQTNRAYSFYAADTSAYNYFGGNVGIGSTTPSQKLSVAGNGYFDGNITASYFTATSTTASVFPYASTTAISSTGSAYFATSGGGVGIGIAPNASFKLEVNGTASTTFLNLPNTSATAGQIKFGGTRFISNAGPSNTFVGANSGNTTVTGDSNTGIGTGALTAIDGGYSNTGIGTNALASNTSGLLNTAVGEGAGQFNTIGNRNSAFGEQALRGNVDGSDNVALGYRALTTSTSTNANVAIGSGALQKPYSDGGSGTGSNNTAVGYVSLGVTTSGHDNAAFGTYSLTANTTGFMNTAIGEEALYLNTTGRNNVALGYEALILSTGDYNTAIGTLAGYSVGIGGGANTTGSSNVFIGDHSGIVSTANQLTNAIAIGTNALVGASNSIVFGNASITAAGFGTTSPSAKLSVTGNGTGTGRLLALANSSDAEKFTVLDNGSTGIGTTSPWGQLSIAPNIANNVPSFVIGSTTAPTFIAAANGNIGFGTSSPTSLHTIVGTTTSVSNAFNEYTSITGVGTTRFPQSLSVLTDSPTTAGSGSVNQMFSTELNGSVTAGTTVGIDNEVFVRGSTTANQRAMTGILNSVRYFGSGTSGALNGMTTTVVASSTSLVSSVTGQTISVSTASVPTSGVAVNTMTGLAVGASNQAWPSGNSAGVTTLNGITATVTNGANGQIASTTNMVGFTSTMNMATQQTVNYVANAYNFKGTYSSNNSSQSTIGNMYGLHLSAASASQPINNQYGVYMSSNYFSGNNNYGIYIDSNTPSYLGGNIGIGTTGSTTVRLAVQSVSSPGTVVSAFFANPDVTNATWAGEAVHLGYSPSTSEASSRIVGFQNSQNSYASRLQFQTHRNAVGSWNTGLFIDENGNVGVGTTTPGQLLSVAGDILGNVHIGSYFTATTTTASVFPYASTTAITSSGPAYFATSGGSVSIGTATQGAKLVVQNPASTGIVIGAFLANPDSTASTWAGESLTFGSQSLTSAASDTTSRIVGFQNPANSFGSRLQIQTHPNIAGGSTWNTGIFMDENGNVGIGTTTPANALTVTGSACISGGTGSTVACSTTAGTISARVHTTANVDLAENYVSSDPAVTAGDIVALDGNLAISITKAGPDSVPFGVVSTNPGILLGGANADLQGNDVRPVALSGRVPVKVNNEGGVIRVGDRIGLSSVPGVGKKATATAETIGVALTSFSGTTGTIEVFVNLRNTTDLSPLDILTKAVADQKAAIAALENSFSTSTVATVASTTVDTIVHTDSFIQTIAVAVKNLIQSSTDWVVAKISGNIALFNRVETEVAAVSRGLEMKDQATGQIYCIAIKNGDWDKQIGACGTVATSTPSAPAPVVVTPVVPASTPAPVVITPDARVATSTEPVAPAATSTPVVSAPVEATSTPVVSAPETTTPAPVVETPASTPESASVTPPASDAPAPVAVGN